MRKQSKRKDIIGIMCTFIQNLYIYTKIYFVDLLCESCFFSRRYYLKEAHFPMLCIDIPPTKEKKAMESRLFTQIPDSFAEDKTEAIIKNQKV